MGLINHTQAQLCAEPGRPHGGFDMFKCTEVVLLGKCALTRRRSVWSRGSKQTVPPVAPVPRALVRMSRTQWRHSVVLLAPVGIVFPKYVHQRVHANTGSAHHKA